MIEKSPKDQANFFLSTFPLMEKSAKDQANFFLSTFRLIEKSAKDQANFFLSTFPLMEKSAKDQADGKCSRTSPFAPTVGLAYARSIRANVLSTQISRKQALGIL